MKHLPTGLAIATLLTSALLLGFTPAYAAAPATPVLFGMDSASATAQANAGIPADYGTFWIGPWTLKSGWGGPDAQLTTMNNAGVTPAIHFYYWGDDITPSCVENGCWSDLHNAQKNRAGWETLGTQLTDHLNSKMNGKPAVIFLESEFNKGGIETYEPFDGYMAAMANKIHAAYPNAIIVLGFGNWGSHAWGTFDRAAAASDMVGIQGMRGSTRQSQSDMFTLYDGLLAGVKSLETKFPGKAIMITDVAVSSYPEPGYLTVQRDVLKEVFDNMATLKSHGVKAIIYRSWLDSPNMDLGNYYGMAERYFGLANSGGQKPSAQVWIDGVKAERAGTVPTPPPAPSISVGEGVTTQVEDFTVKSAGGRQGDNAAQEGFFWNLWSNGQVVQSFNLSGEYELTVRARGTSATGIRPHMDVFVAGTKVLAADPGTAYQDYKVPVSGNGPTEVRIAFTNDVRTSTEDRNLLLDFVAFARPAVNNAPVAQFTASVQDLTAQLDATTSYDSDGDALTYAWDFGDGTTGFGRTASRDYATAGDYTVTLTVSDSQATATTQRTITATQPNRAPIASFTANTNMLKATVDASASSDADGDALSYAWNFGDGTTGFGRTASRDYATAGDYTVTLTVSDGMTSATATRTVTVVVYQATFATHSASNEWWVQEKVASTPAPVKVEVRVNGGAWQALKLQSYGDWTLSTHITKGSQVVFRATAPDGQTALSSSQPWLGPAPAPSTFKATFTPKSVGNDWWIESKVSANEPIAKVEAKVGSNPYVTLNKQDWGTYAKSLHAPNGTPVVFRATSTTGATSTSSTVTWT